MSGLAMRAAWSPFREGQCLVPRGVRVPLKAMFYAFMLMVLAPQKTLQAQQPYDLLLKGGHVIDAKNHINRVMDVAIAKGKIARVAVDIPGNQAKRAVNCAGLYVAPGLIDDHAHVYTETGSHIGIAGDYSVYPDAFSFRSGVTTMVDAGTSGWRTFPDFKERIIDHARTRVLAFVNIVGYGMENPSVQQDVRQMDPVATARSVREYPDIIVGIKTAHFAGPEWTALEGAIEAGNLAHVPVMVDYGPGHPNRPFSEALKRMRPGDMYTHFYGRPRPLMDENGKLLSYFLEARKRGVLFDVGHGAGSLLFRQAVPAIRQGFVPDSISTDIHAESMNAGMKDILNVMSKFLNMGISLQDVVRFTTWNPANQIHHTELGNLSEGGEADVVVLRLLKGHYGFVDANGARLSGTQKLEAELTIKAGRVEWDLNGITRDEWTTLPPEYGVQGDPSWDATLPADLFKPPTR